MREISARNKFLKDSRQKNPRKLPQEKPISKRDKPFKRKPKGK